MFFFNRFVRLSVNETRGIGFDWSFKGKNGDGDWCFPNWG